MQWDEMLHESGTVLSAGFSCLFEMEMRSAEFDQARSGAPVVHDRCHSGGAALSSLARSTTYLITLSTMDCCAPETFAWSA